MVCAPIAVTEAREQGFQRTASLTTIALETIRIARQLVDQATVDSCLLKRSREGSLAVTLPEQQRARRDVSGRNHLRVVLGEHLELCPNYDPCITSHGPKQSTSQCPWAHSCEAAADRGD